MAKRTSSQSLDAHYEQLRLRSEREDLVMFINACFAATSQHEYYTDRLEQSVSIGFLHQYVLANYRRVYARSLAAGINHFNQALVVTNLLRVGAPADPDHRSEEGELIAAALRSLPANRAYGVLRSLQRQRINNRRTRAVVKRFLQHRRDPAFDAVKYRNKYRSAAAHAHVRLERDFGKFLFGLDRTSRFDTPIFDSYQRARYSQAAIYELPFTIAESFAERHGVRRDQFLKKIEPKMTATEKLRYQESAKRTKGAKLPFDLSRAPLTRLALYVLSLSTVERESRRAELDGALATAATRAVTRSRLSLGRVVALLDRSRSSSGTRQKQNRPLAVAVAANYLLQAASSDYVAIWTPAVEPGQSPYEIGAAGQTALAEPLIDAIELQPDLIVIVSDGYENDPPEMVGQVAEVYRDRLSDDSFPEIVHMNPVFDADHYSPRVLGPAIATIGLRDAEDIATMLGFARFARGAASLSELETYLQYRSQTWLESCQRTELA